MKKVTLFIFTTFIFCFASAQKAYVEDLEDDSNARLAMNRANPNPNPVKNDEFDRVPTKSKKVPLLERFSGPTIADSVWTQRAEVTLWHDNQDRLVSVQVDNGEVNDNLNLEQTFTKMCDEDALYQLNIPDYELISS